MKCLLLGATGRTGRLVVQTALARAHHVTALVRSKHSLTSSDALRVVVGDVTKLADLTAVARDQDVVISCLGHRSSGDAALLRSSAEAMIEAMDACDVRRYVTVSQGLLFPSGNPLIAVLRFAFRRQVADSIAMERLVQASDLEWTIVRAPRLLEGGMARGYRVAVNARPRGPASMQRADLASCLVDVAERREHVRQVVGLTAG